MTAVEQLLIDGERVPSAEGRTFETVNPANGEVFRTVAEAGAEDADRAVRAAARAFEDWGARTPIQRAKVLYRWADLIEEHADELALIETRDMGMAIGDARWCAGNAAAVMRYYAGAVDKFFGSTIPVDRDGIVLTFREPIGVTALITPWNFPLNIGNWKTAPALAAGNTVVLKPASLSPLSALRYAELGLEAGLPAGCAQRRPRPGERGRRRARRAPARRQGRLHRLDRGRRRDRAQGGRDDQARDARARRQERVHRLRRRRSREGRTHGALLGVRERGAGLLRALAPARRGLGEGRAARALRRGDPRRSSSATRSRPTRRWARSSPPASARRSRGTSRGASRRARPCSRAGHGPTGLDGGFYLRPTILDGCTNDMVVAREEIFGPGGVGDHVRDRGRGDPARERHAVRPLRVALDEGRRPPAPRRPRASDRRDRGQLEQLGLPAGAVRRLQGTRASARSSGWKASSTTPS